MELILEFTGFGIADDRIYFDFVTVYLIRKIITADGECVGPHGCKIAHNSAFQYSYGCQDTHQGKNTYADNTDGKYGPEQLAPYGIKGYSCVFPEQIEHDSFFDATKIRKLLEVSGLKVSV